VFVARGLKRRVLTRGGAIIPAQGPTSQAWDRCPRVDAQSSIP